MFSRQTNRRDRISAFVLLVLASKLVNCSDPTLKNCMEEPQEVSDSSYSTALSYFQKCLDLGKSASKEELPPGYFNKVAENMRQSFEEFLEDSGLGEEQLAAIRKEIRELSGGIRHVPRKKTSNPSLKNSSHCTEAKAEVHAEIPNKISSKTQSKKLDNSTSADQPENTLHLQFVNNIWPHQMYNIFPPEEQQSSENHNVQQQQQHQQQQQQEQNEQQLNLNKSSLMRSSAKCGSKRNANGVELLTLFLCIVTLAVCAWMAYKIYCQYQLWARVRYEASHHKTETTPLNRSESCISQKNEEKKEGVCYSKPKYENNGTRKKRGFLENDE